MIDKLAGLPTQIRQLEKRLKEMDGSKVKPSVLKEITDTIQNLKNLLKEKTEKREQRKRDKEQKASEVEKESAIPAVVAPGAATAPTSTTTSPAATPAPAATPDDQKVSCPLCGGMTFNDNAAYQQHMAYTHASDIMPTNPGQKEDKLVASVETDAASRCANCGQSFNSYAEYVDHKNHEKDAPKQYTPMDPNKKKDVVKNVEKNLGPAIISEKEDESALNKKIHFKLDQIVKPVRGSESKGKVMRHDGPEDLAYVMWEEGALKDRDGFGGYYPQDLSIAEEEKPIEASADETPKEEEHCPCWEDQSSYCPKCKSKKTSDLRTNYDALLKDLKEERDIHYTQGNNAWVARLDQKIMDLENSIKDKFPSEKQGCPTCGSVKESGHENGSGGTERLTIVDHSPAGFADMTDSGEGKDDVDSEFESEWAEPKIK